MRYFTRVFLLSIMAVMISLASCQDEKIKFKEFQKFNGDLEWTKADVKSFEINVEELNDSRELILAFRCASGFAFRNILVKMIETDPLGHSTERILDIPVRQENGEFYGEKGFDIIDIEYAIDLAKTFDHKGNWKYSFAHVMPNTESIDFPMELGLILRLPKNG